MTDPCAVCGEKPAVDELPCPMDWTDYLRENRDFGPPIGSVWIPLCGECYSRADRLTETQHDLGFYEGETRESVESDITEFLDGLNLGALVDKP